MPTFESSCTFSIFLYIYPCIWMHTYWTKRRRDICQGIVKWGDKRESSLANWHSTLAVHCRRSQRKMATMLSRTISLAENLTRFNGAKVRSIDLFRKFNPPDSISLNIAFTKLFVKYENQICRLTEQFFRDRPEEWGDHHIRFALCSLLNWAPGSSVLKPRIFASLYSTLPIFTILLIFSPRESLTLM